MVFETEFEEIERVTFDGKWYGIPDIGVKTATIRQYSKLKSLY